MFTFVLDLILPSSFFFLRLFSPTLQTRPRFLLGFCPLLRSAGIQVCTSPFSSIFPRVAFHSSAFPPLKAQPHVLFFHFPRTALFRIYSFPLRPYHHGAPTQPFAPRCRILHIHPPPYRCAAIFPPICPPRSGSSGAVPTNTPAPPPPQMPRSRACLLFSPLRPSRVPTPRSFCYFNLR